MFQMIAALRPWSCAGGHGDRCRHGEQAGQHIANPRWQRPHAGQEAAQPGSKKDAAVEIFVKLESNEPGRRHRIEHLPCPLRQQQQWRADGSPAGKSPTAAAVRLRRRCGKTLIDGRAPGDSEPTASTVP